MQYMLMIYDRQCDEFAQSVVKSGHFRAGARLRPSSMATTLRENNGKLVTADGPFVETREQIAGYLLVECKDLGEAISIGARCQSAGGPAVVVEVRPLMPTS